MSVYALFVVAAGARSAVQLVTGPREALPAYVLSAVAAAGYAVGLVLVVLAARGVPRAVAAMWCVLELAGVVAVGAISLFRPSAFAADTVWSDFGAGYGFVPLLLPAAVLVWLAAEQRTTDSEAVPLNYSG